MEICSTSQAIFGNDAQSVRVQKGVKLAFMQILPIHQCHSKLILTPILEELNSNTHKSFD